uniref:Peptidase M1 alanyl aminopeptidase C-terminal domain-containing protein n=1 Tax=Tetraselmis sp. GSL018 TaxID=582737 RepID=A0A061R688_9CHLO
MLCSPLPSQSPPGSAFLQRAERCSWLLPQVAARMVSCFTTWRRMDSVRQAKMKEQLELIVAEKGISDNTFEIASKSLE